MSESNVGDLDLGILKDAICGITTTDNNIKTVDSGTTTSDGCWISDSTSVTNVTTDQILVSDGGSLGSVGASWEPSMVIAPGPWSFGFKNNGDLEIVFEEDNKRIEYQIRIEDLHKLFTDVAKFILTGKEHD